MKKQRFEFRTILALILVMTIILLPFDTLALTGQAVTSEGTATPDEAESIQREKDVDLAQTGTNILDGEGSQESPYIIATSDDWDALSVSINSGSTEYSGKYFELTDDITVTTVLGSRPDSSTDSNDNYFSGTFDGGGHELNVNINESGFGAAPFAIAHNATIKNLHVTGTVKSGANHATGLVAASKGRSIYDASYLTIQNVTVSTDISCPSHIAGIVGHAHSADITMENVVFDGSLNASNIQGGMIGWGGLGNGASFNASFKDCLFAGTYNTNAAFYPVAFANGQGTATLINDFYTTTFGGGGSPITTTGDGQVKLLAAQVEKDGSVKYFDNINTAADGSNWVEGSTLKLMTDVTTGSTITVPAGEHTLDLNGHGILMTGNDRVITINQGASLDLNDSDPDTIHYITLTDYRGTAVSGSGEESVSNGNGVIKVTGGYLSGGYRNNSGSHDRCGAGVYNWGTFVMNGGNIVGNTLYNNSGGAIRNSGYFTMNGGTIAFNYASGNGGGVTTYVPGGSQGKMTMNGGEISDNYCGSYGGGIQIAGPIEMTGGSVVRNTAGAGGSGVYYGGQGDKFKLSGNPVIKDNTNDNLYMDTNATFMISDSLTKGADVHVFMKTPAAFTVGWKDKMSGADPENYFTSDDKNYSVILNNGEAAIGNSAAKIKSDGSLAYYPELSSAINAWTAGSTLILTKDATISSTITVPSGEHTLDLNGYGIKMTGNGSVFVVGSGSKMIINDSNTDAEHKYTLSNIQSNGAGFATVNDSLTSGYKTFKGGYITGGNGNTRSSWREGGALHITGEVEMNAGTLIGNGKYGTTHGGGFETRDSGRFVMHGGSIQNNGGYCGGGCRLVGGSAEIDGGRIIDNIATNDGGGIHVGGTLPLVLKDCEISGNYANGGPGAGIWMSNVGTEISGKTVIKDNYVGNKADNIEIQKDKLIGIGNLTDGASIGITMQSGPAVFTSGWKDNMGDADPSKYFTSDDSNYAVILNNNGEAEIAPPPVASIISGDVTTNYSTISDAVNAWTAGSTLKLVDDITTGGTVTVPSGEHTLDLNGYALKAGSAGYSVITVGSGADLTINDTAGKEGKITGGSVGQNYGGGVTVDGGTLTLKGGAISGNANTYGGIGNCGGGVHVRNGGKFYMEGGEISGNTSYVGGGVCSDASATTVSITGGVIKNNKTDRFGSAIWAGRSSSAVFRIGGDVQIIDNISTWTADKDGEASLNFSTLLISGDPTVHGDWKANGTSSPNTHINLDNDGSGIQCIELEGALTNDTGSPSITMSPIYRWNDLANGQTFVFTKNWNKYMGTAHPADYFKLDDSVSGVTVIRKDGEAAFTGSGDLGDLYITFDANEGKGAMDPQLVTATNATLNKNTFTRDGYAFAGWNTEKDGSGTAYADKASITLSGDLTLYAQWKEPAASIVSGETTTSYSSLSDAVNAWTVGSTLKLLKDVSNDTTITVSAGEHILDLNGHTLLELSTVGKFMVGSGASSIADLTIIDSVGTGVIKHETSRPGSLIWIKEGSSLTLDGGTLEANSSASPVIDFFQQKNASFTMNGGKIIGTANNGAVRFGADCTFTMTGGEISGLQTSTGLFDYSVGSGGAINISGAPVVKNNTANGTVCNFNLPDGRLLNINGEMTDGASVGVTKVSKTGVFTSGWKDNMGDADPSKYFTSDNDDYIITLNDSGEACLRYPVVPDVSAEGFEGDYDGATHSITVSAPDGAEIKYGTSEGSYTLTDNPTYTEAGTYTVYYEVSKEKHTSVHGSAQVKIDKINATVTITGHNTTVDYDSKAHSADGYDAAASTDLYDVTKDFKYNGRAEAVRTNIGTTVMGLSAEQFENLNANFASVTFEVTDGYVKINPVAVTVTITGHNDAVDYDGKAHSVSGYDVEISSPLYSESDFTFSGTAGVERTDAGTTEMGLAPDQFENTNSNFPNVTFEVIDGYVTIDPKAVTVTIVGHNSTADYDGKAHEVSGYDVTAISESLYSESDFTFNGTAQAQRTDAGTTEMGLADEQFENTNSNFAVTFEVTDGYQKISPISVGVAIVGYNSTSDYNGKSHSVSGYVAAFSNPLYTESDFTFSGTAKAERTDAGTTKMGLASDQFENTNSNFKNVTFTVVDGYVTINPIDVTVTVVGHNNTVDYDGQAHSADGYDATADSKLYDVNKDFIYNGRAEAVRTDAGTTEMGLTAENFENTNANFDTVTFEVTDGYMTVNPVDVVVTVTGHNDTVDYDGKAHSAEGYDVEFSNPLYSESDFTFSGTAKAERTDAGTTEMGLTADQFENTNSNFAKVTFDVTDGYMTVEPINVKVVVTGNSDTIDYDGKSHTVSGYTFAATSALYTESDFTFSGTAEAQRTDAGTTNMGLNAEQFENTSNNFAQVTFEVSDGSITIDPIDVTVTITGHNDTVDYDGKVHSVDGYDAKASTDLYDVTKDFTFSGTAKAERTDAGTTEMGLNADQFENTNSNFATVTFDVTDGYVTIDPIDVTVTITGHNGTADYDGKAHSVDGYDAAASSDLYDVNKDFTFSGRAEAVRTNAGKTEMGLSADQFANTNSNFATVTFDVTDGYIKIDPIDVTVTVTGYNFTTDYDGEMHFAEGYYYEISDPLYTEDDFTFSGRAEAVRTNAGTSMMDLAAEQFENTNSNFANVTFDITDGYVKINSINVTVSITGHNSTADYDGKAHSVDGYDAAASSDLYDVTKDFTFSGTAEAERTDAGTTEMGLAADQFENTNSNFANVTFDVTDGYMTVDPIEVTVTITGHNGTADYDGKAHSVDGYDASASSDLYDVYTDFTFSGRAEAVRTNSGKTDMGLNPEQFKNINSNFANVTFEITDGCIKIDPIDITVTITGHNSTVDYDGKAHSVDGYDAVADSDLYDVNNDFTFSGRAEAIRTDAGKTDMGLTVDQFKNTNTNFDTVSFNVTDGYIMIGPIDVIVTITGHNSTVDYDGKSHVAEGYDVESSDPLYSESDFTFSGTAKAEATDVGTVMMGLADNQFENTNSNFETVVFIVTDGYVKVEPIDVTVTVTGHNSAVDYDGKSHIVEGYDAVSSSYLYDVAEDFTFSGTAKAERTDAGTTNMGLSAGQFENTNSNFATVTFDVTDGYITVNPLNVTVTITGHNDTVDYDGKAHSVEGYDAVSSSDLYDVAEDFNFSGTAKAERTDAGTTDMGLSADKFENTNSNFANVTFNVTDGYMTVNPINITVTITGHNYTVNYDGNAHSADGYDAAANSDLYDVTNDFTFSGRAEAVRTNAGTSMMGLSAEQFENTNSNFDNVVFSVTDGYLTVNTVDAVITTAPHAKSDLIYNGSEQELVVAGTVDGGTLYYAIGKNSDTSPTDDQYNAVLPVGKDAGNYYIWYKVKGDSNHNDIDPAYVKVTMAEQGWGTVSGGIVDENNNPVSNAKVTLTAGGKVIDEVISGSDGSYFFTVPSGIYNIVVKSDEATVTEMVDVADRTTYDVTMPDSDTDSLLDVVDSDSDIVVGGLSKEAALIRDQESVPDSQNVTVKMTVKTISGSETEGSKAIIDYAPDKNFKFYNFKVEKTVDSLTTEMDTTQSVLEIAIPCSFTNKSEFAVYNNSSSGVQTLTESDTKAAGTYRVDQQNGMVYIYTDSITTYAVGYKPYYSVTSDVSLGSYTGEVSVSLTKDGSSETYELNNVSLQNISFNGIPKGTYSMTVTWTDGAENTITTPFIIK